MRTSLADIVSTEAETACPLRLRPRPSDVQLLEIYVSALSIQSLRLRLYTKQRSLNAVLLPRDVYQSVPAGLHQVEPLTVDVLQVRIANGRGASAGSSHTWRRAAAVDVKHHIVQLLITGALGATIDTAVT
jgi:hypothetical protein